MVYNWFNLLQRAWPGRCLLCADAGVRTLDLCGPCRAELPRNQPACAVCALPLPAAAPSGSRCGACQQRPPPFERIRAPFLYQAPLPQLIGGFKYGHRLAAGRLLGQLLAGELAPLLPGSDRPDALLPVPLHPQRLRQRGFNQAAELARNLGRELRIPVRHGLLRRTRHTPAQAGLGRADRLRNLRGAFRLGRRDGVQHVALVDDVVTTGATAEALARLLRDAGVARVELWAVARTPRRAG